MSKLPSLWKYDHADQATWKYKSCHYTEGTEHRKFVRWYINENFKYKDIDPTYRQECTI